MFRFFPRLFLSLAAVVLMQSPLHAGIQEVVVCDFSADKEGEIPTALRKEEQSELPMKSPTSAVSGENGKLFVQKKGVGGYDKPVAVFEPGPHPQNPDGVGGIKLNWDLRQAALGPGGVYELECTVIAVALPINGGGRLKFTLLSAEGRFMQGVSVHASEMPVLSFGAEKFGSAKNKITAGDGQPMQVKMRIDLEKNEWAAWIDGEPVVETTPLPPAIFEAYPQVMLGAFDFGSEGGLGDKVGGSYAIGGIKLVRIEK